MDNLELTDEQVDLIQEFIKGSCYHEPVGKYDHGIVADDETPLVVGVTDLFEFLNSARK